MGYSPASSNSTHAFPQQQQYSSIQAPMTFPPQQQQGYSSQQQQYQYQNPYPSTNNPLPAYGSMPPQQVQQSQAQLYPSHNSPSGMYNTNYQPHQQQPGSSIPTQQQQQQPQMPPSYPPPPPPAATMTSVPVPRPSQQLRATVPGRAMRAPYTDPVTQIMYTIDNPEYEGFLTKQSSWLKVCACRAHVLFVFSCFYLLARAPHGAKQCVWFLYCAYRACV